MKNYEINMNCTFQLSNLKLTKSKCIYVHINKHTCNFEKEIQGAVWNSVGLVVY